MDILLELIIIIFAVALSLFAFQRYQKSTPAFLFTIVWTAQIIVVLLGWSNYLYFRYWGLLFILAGVLCFDLGYQVVAKKTTNTNIYNNKQVYYHSRRCLYVYLGVLLIAFAAVFYSIYSRGFSWRSFFDINSFIEMSYQSSVERYTGDDNEGALAKILGINSYTCPLIGGLMFHYFEKKKKYLSYIAILPNILGGLSQGVKMGIISSIFLWAIGKVVASHLQSKQLKLKLRQVLLISIGAIAFMLLMIVTMMFRYGTLDLDTFYVASGKMISYGLGHLPAFDLWYVGHQENITELTLGGKTIYGITNTLGILTREQGVFTTMYQISPYGDETNVFTAFRFYIEDFGTLGSFVYLFIMGSVCRFFYDRFRELRNVYLNATIMCAIYFYISWSFATSVFAYATYIAMFLYLFVLLKLMFSVKYNREVIQGINN